MKKYEHMRDKHRYSVFCINNIVLDSRAQFDHQIPPNYRHSNYLYFVLVSILKLFKNMLKTLVKSPLRYKFTTCKDFKHLYNDTILFRLPTINNSRSLQRVIENVSQHCENVKVVEKGLVYTSYPLLLIDILSLFHLRDIWKSFRLLDNHDRRTVCYFIDYYIHTHGVIWFYRKMLEQYRPKCVILANDHMFLTKPLELLCEDFKIPCIYVQHSSVSYAFPELHFSCSFLDGTDSLNKYTSNGKQSTGYIISLGAVRYDNLSKYRISRNNNMRKCIGVAVNELDDNTICNSVCDELLSLFPDYTIKVRMHPAMKDRPFKFNNIHRIICTCATDETIIEYFDSIDVQIASDSGIHLDAILGGIRTVAFNFSHSSYEDNYEYLKSGLLHLAENVSQLADFINDPEFYKIGNSSIRLYDESFEKTYSGHCSDIIADYITLGCNFELLLSKYSMEKKVMNSSVYYVIPQ